MMSARFLIVVATLIGAIIATQTISHGKPTPLKKDFATFPAVIGPWRGIPSFFGPKIEGVAGMDHYILKRYTQKTGPFLWLYVGYYESQRKGDSIHSPKNCYPGSGWQTVNSGLETIEVTASPARTITVNRYIIQKGLDKRVVLYWYQSRGRVYASEYWGKIYLVLDSIMKNRTDGSLVRISAPVVDSVEATLERERAFVQDAFPLLTQFLPD